MESSTKIAIFSLFILLLIVTWTLLYLVAVNFQFDIGTYFNYFKNSGYWLKRISLIALFIAEIGLFYTIIKLPEKYVWNGKMQFGILMVFLGLIYLLALIFGVFLTEGKSI